ncbi:helix-turn-helix domain-containing protein [Bacillota bacterium LCP21S3_F9]|jgi:DNA-binding Xre family transcriptional regulator
MAVSYNKLWKLLIDKGMKRTELRDAVDMSTNTLARLGKNDYISLEVLDRICTYLQCDIGDVMEFVPGKKDEKSKESSEQVEVSQ